MENKPKIKITTRNELLLLAADFLEKKGRFKRNKQITEDNFDISTWKEETSRASCGYTACAVGHLALNRTFNQLGLTLELESETGSLVPRFGNEVSDQAVCNFFKIDWDTMRNFFYWTKYDKHLSEITPSDVAQNIRRWVAANPE